MADVKPPQLGHRMLTRDPTLLGAAIERPVMEDCELAIGGGMNVDLDNVGARVKSGAYPANRVLQVIVGRRQHPCRSAGVVLQVVLVETLRDPAMREQDGISLVTRRQKTGIVDIDAHRDRGDYRDGIFDLPAQSLAPPRRTFVTLCLSAICGGN